MKKIKDQALWMGKIILGCALFAVSFDLFLEPNDLNAGGVSGLAMVLVQILGVGSVGVVTALMNLPLFALGGMKIGKNFFWGSLAGMIASSALLDLLTVIPIPKRSRCWAHCTAVSSAA